MNYMYLKLMKRLHWKCQKSIDIKVKSVITSYYLSVQTDMFGAKEGDMLYSGL